MDGYNSRGLMLDPGLTALALRAVHDHSGNYPFIDRYRRRRRSVPRPATASAPEPVSRWPRVLQWLRVAVSLSISPPWASEAALSSRRLRS
jgi:hypothetical protein